MKLLGFIAATFTTIAFLPQVFLVYRTKKTEDISLGMFSIFSIGIVLWLIYGILKIDYPIIIANGVTLILSCYILVSKCKYK